MSFRLDQKTSNVRFNAEGVRKTIAKRRSFGPRRSLIAATVQDSGDQDVPIVPIVDDVTFDGERANAVAELWPKTTHPGLFG